MFLAQSGKNMREKMQYTARADAVQGRMQCSARTDAVQCKGGCSALRLRWEKTGTEI